MGGLTDFALSVPTRFASLVESFLLGRTFSTLLPFTACVVFFSDFFSKVGLSFTGFETGSTLTTSTDGSWVPFRGSLGLGVGMLTMGTSLASSGSVQVKSSILKIAFSRDSSSRFIILD